MSDRAGRPVFNRRKQRVWTAQVYTPTKLKTPDGWKSNGLEEWKSRVHNACKRAIPTPYEGPLEIEIVVYLPRPKRLDGKRHDPGAVRCDKAVGDADNFAKAILDAMHGAAFHNDAQVSDLISRKRYAASGCASGVKIAVKRVEESPGLFS